MSIPASIFFNITRDGRRVLCQFDIVFIAYHWRTKFNDETWCHLLRHIAMATSLSLWRHFPYSTVTYGILPYYMFTR